MGGGYGYQQMLTEHLLSITTVLDVFWALEMGGKKKSKTVPTHKEFTFPKTKCWPPIHRSFPCFKGLRVLGLGLTQEKLALGRRDSKK